MTISDFKAIHQILHKVIAGSRFEACSYYVGGCVRDTYLHREINDINISVNMHGGGIALATYITKVFDCYEEGRNPIIDIDQGLAVFNIGKKYPALQHITITSQMTCKEVYNEYSKVPRYVYSCINEDALRRDLTINAIYVKISDTSKYHFYLEQSHTDIENKTIRAIGDPVEKFRNNPVDMLRTLRLAAELGWGIEKNTWIALCKCASEIDFISGEAIQKELNKILISDRADETIRRMYHNDILAYLLPELSTTYGIEQGKEHKHDVFEHSIEVMMNTKPKPINRMAGLLHDIGKIYTSRSGIFSNKGRFIGHENTGATLVKSMLDFLNYPKPFTDAVATAVKLHMRFKGRQIPSRQAIRKFLAEAKKGNLDLCLDVIHADNLSHAKKYCMPEQVGILKQMIAKIEEKEQESKIKLPITGKDIMKEYNLPKGPKIGKALSLLKEHYCISPKMSRDEALSVVSDAIKRKQI